MVGDLRTAVDATLAALDLGDRDQAAAELARLLADEIDQAEVAERVAERALRMTSDEPDEDVELKDLIRSLRTRCGHRDAIVRCGQRLEGILVQLQATPAARGKTSGTPFTGGALQALRGGLAG
jgi:hypothetical protein